MAGICRVTNEGKCRKRGGVLHVKNTVEAGRGETGRGSEDSKKAKNVRHCVKKREGDKDNKKRKDEGGGRKKAHDLAKREGGGGETALCVAQGGGGEEEGGRLFFPSTGNSLGSMRGEAGKGERKAKWTIYDSTDGKGCPWGG